jgi:hypothetical protein
MALKWLEKERAKTVYAEHEKACGCASKKRNLLSFIP